VSRTATALSRRPRRGWFHRCLHGRHDERASSPVVQLLRRARIGICFVPLTRRIDLPATCRVKTEKPSNGVEQADAAVTMRLFRSDIWAGLVSAA
jgi:hypothetical protein